MVHGPFDLSLQRTGLQPAGTITGTVDKQFGDVVQPYVTVNAVSMKGGLSGQTDNLGRFHGTVDGDMTLWQFGFLCDKEAFCATSGFGWTLMPHSRLL